MKAYLTSTGAIFGLFAVLHLLRPIAERNRLKTEPLFFPGMAGLGILAAALSVWAWRLLFTAARRLES